MSKNVFLQAAVAWGRDVEGTKESSPPPPRNLHFDEGVGVAVGVHGGQVYAAHHTHDEPILLAVVHERDENASALLHIADVLPRLPGREQGSTPAGRAELDYQDGSGGRGQGKCAKTQKQ